MDLHEIHTRISSRNAIQIINYLNAITNKRNQSISRLDKVEFLIKSFKTKRI